MKNSRSIISSYGPCGKFKLISTVVSTNMSCSCRDILQSVNESNTRDLLDDSNGMRYMFVKSFTDQFQSMIDRCTSSVEEHRHRLLVLRGLEYLQRTGDSRIRDALKPYSFEICQIDENNWLHNLVFTFLTTHMSISLSRMFSALFLSLIEETCSGDLHKDILHLRKNRNYRICGIPNAPVQSSSLMNGIIISHCSFTRNSIREARNCRIMFLKKIENEEQIEGASVICITDNYLETIPHKMIVKVEKVDMEFLLGLFSVEIGQHSEVKLAQHVVSGTDSHLLLIPLNKEFQTLLIRAPVLQICSQYCNLLKCILNILVSGSVIRAMDGGGSPELILSNVFSGLSSDSDVPLDLRPCVSLVSEMVSKSYESIVNTHIYQITERTPTIHVLHEMRQKNHSFISIPHAPQRPQTEVPMELWTVAQGRDYGIIDHVETKIHFFRTVCIDLISHYRIDSVLRMKSSSSNTSV